MKHILNFSSHEDFEELFEVPSTFVAFDNEHIHFSGNHTPTIIYYADNTTKVNYPINYSGIYGLNKNIVKVEFGSSVTEINSLAFSACFNLASVTIPTSITYISSYAFSECTSLESITYLGTLDEWSAVTKGNKWNNLVPTTCTVHCTNGDLSISEA